MIDEDIVALAVLGASTWPDAKRTRFPSAVRSSYGTYVQLSVDQRAAQDAQQVLNDSPTLGAAERRAVGEKLGVQFASVAGDQEATIPTPDCEAVDNGDGSVKISATLTVDGVLGQWAPMAYPENWTATGNGFWRHVWTLSGDEIEEEVELGGTPTKVRLKARPVVRPREIMLTYSLAVQTHDIYRDDGYLKVTQISNEPPRSRIEVVKNIGFWAADRHVIAKAAEFYWVPAMVRMANQCRAGQLPRPTGVSGLAHASQTVMDVMRGWQAVLEKYGMLAGSVVTGIGALTADDERERAQSSTRLASTWQEYVLALADTAGNQLGAVRSFVTDLVSGDRS